MILGIFRNLFREEIFPRKRGVPSFPWGYNTREGEEASSAWWNGQILNLSRSRGMAGKIDPSRLSERSFQEKIRSNCARRMLAVASSILEAISLAEEVFTVWVAAWYTSFSASSSSRRKAA